MSSVQRNKQKVWLITGTSSGFGRHLVNLVLARNDYVIATARCAEKIQTFPSSERLRILQLDVNDDYQLIKAIVDEAASYWGRIDVLVNNAGTSMKALFEEGGSAKCMEQFQTNVFGVINVTNAVLPYMRARRSGTIVMMGSRTTWSANTPTAGFYFASKAAVHAFSEALAEEVKHLSIRVLVVQPGAFRTEGILNGTMYKDDRISDYDKIRDDMERRWKSTKFIGDPAKAMDVVVKVVKEEGVAAERPWPLFLFLGESAERSVKDRCGLVLNLMDEWRDVTKDLNFDQ